MANRDDILSLDVRQKQDESKHLFFHDNFPSISAGASILPFDPMIINKRAIWNGYLVTLVVRGVVGAILGVGVGILFCYRSVLYAIGEDHYAALGYLFLISSGIGLVVGMVTSPEESLPWKTIKNLEKRQQETRH